MTANVRIPSIGVRSGRGITIEDIYPTIDGGHFAVERIDGEPVDVWANILRDGNAVLTAELLWAIENLITGERITTEWGEVRLPRIYMAIAQQRGDVARLGLHIHGFVAAVVGRKSRAGAHRY